MSSSSSTQKSVNKTTNTSENFGLGNTSGTTIIGNKGPVTASDYGAVNSAFEFANHVQAYGAQNFAQALNAVNHSLDSVQQSEAVVASAAKAGSGTLDMQKVLIVTLVVGGVAVAFALRKK